jgi:CheY-like chemotaxis protein
MLHLLLVEDNPADARLFIEAFKGTEVSVRWLDDSEAALGYLLCNPPYEKVPRPQLLVVDINLPKITGPELLVELKRRPQLSDIPVAVFTSSTSPDDREKCEKLGVKAYAVKPTDIGSYIANARALAAVVLPR